MREKQNQVVNRRRKGSRGFWKLGSCVRMFRQNSPAPSARFCNGISRYRRRERSAVGAVLPPIAAPVAPPRRRSKLAAAAEDSKQRRRWKSYDNLNFPAKLSDNCKLREPMLNTAAAAAAKRSIDSAEGFGRRFRRSIRRISKAKVMQVSLQWAKAELDH